MIEKYQKILQIVVGVIEQDYAGQPECAPRNELDKMLTALLAAEQNGTLDDEVFAAEVSDYLAGFQDPALFLEVSGREEKPPVSAASSFPENNQEENTPPAYLLSQKFHADLRPAVVEVRQDAGPCHNQRAVIISIHQFVDGSALQVMQQHFDELQQASRVVIDVRRVHEGMIGNAFCLLALFFNSPVNLKDLMGEEMILTRYSQLNAQMRLHQLARLSAVSDAAGMEWLQAEKEHVAACAGKGFVVEAQFEEDMMFPPGPEGQQVFLLTDQRTAGPAERLVAIAQRAAAVGCGKVCCVGGATRGSLDYSNMLSLPLSEALTLVYPMSKTKAAHEGCGIRGKGLSPDVLVDCSAEESAADLVLETALHREGHL